MMPRVGRKKSEGAMYHVMSRSISEIELFQSDEDKAYYLMLLKRYKERYKCRIYAYCLMDNHVHLFIDPDGFDISTFMLSLNGAYVSYFNRCYKRHGHLFQGRFASKMVDNDTYSITLSAYVHNNAKDLPGYAGKEEMYRYSSYGIYTGARRDIEGLVDTEYILGLFSSTPKTARYKYRIFTEAMKETGILKEVDESIMRAYTENEYRNEKRLIVRVESPDELVRKLENAVGERIRESLRMKYGREASKIRAFATYLMRMLCGYSYKRLCQYLGNMSMSGISRLSNEGHKLLGSDVRYRNAFNSLVNKR